MEVANRCRQQHDISQREVALQDQLSHEETSSTVMIRPAASPGNLKYLVSGALGRVRCFGRTRAWAGCGVRKHKSFVCCFSALEAEARLHAGLAFVEGYVWHSAEWFLICFTDF